MSNVDAIIEAVERLKQVFLAAGLDAPKEVVLASRDELRRLSLLVENDKVMVNHLRTPPEVLESCIILGVKIRAGA